MREMVAPGRWREAPTVKLSPRLDTILTAVRSTNGNRARAARYLGLSTTAVQAAMKRCAKAGVAVPPALPSRRGQPNLHPMPPRPLGPRCGVVMRYKRVPCALGVGHPQGHRSPASVAAGRKPR